MDEKRLEAFEKMLVSVQTRYDETSAKLERLKQEGKTKTATFRQLMGDKMIYGNILSIYRIYGLID